MSVKVLVELEAARSESRAYGSLYAPSISLSKVLQVLMPSIKHFPTAKKQGY